MSDTGPDDDRPVLDEFTRRVLYERARLALVDPQGEARAVAPLDKYAAWAILARLEDRKGIG